VWHFLENDNFSLRSLEALLGYIEKDVLVLELEMAGTYWNTLYIELIESFSQE